MYSFNSVFVAAHLCTSSTDASMYVHLLHLYRHQSKRSPPLQPTSYVHFLRLYSRLSMYTFPTCTVVNLCILSPFAQSSMYTFPACTVGLSMYISPACTASHLCTLFPLAQPPICVNFHRLYSRQSVYTFFHYTFVSGRNWCLSYCSCPGSRIPPIGFLHCRNKHGSGGIYYTSQMKHRGTLRGGRAGSGTALEQRQYPFLQLCRPGSWVVLAGETVVVDSDHSFGHLMPQTRPRHQSRKGQFFNTVHKTRTSSAVDITSKTSWREKNVQTKSWQY